MKVQSDDVSEIRKILLANGVQSFRLQAGFIPKNAPDDECSIFPDAKYLRSRWSYGTVSIYDERAFVHEVIIEDEFVIFEIHATAIVVKCCSDCTNEYQKLVGDAFVLWYELVDEFCPICGKYEDGIPF